MRVIHCVLIAWAGCVSGAALAQHVGSAAAGKTDVAPIQFDLSVPRSAQPRKLPTATTLGELTYATEDRPAAKPVTKPKPAAKPAPRPARKLAAAKPAKGPWMSEWRRAYIARHGHQPPVPAR